VGFVPTMGYLHAGHASLMAAARADTDLVVASIFVNPLQFAPTEDLDAYPRDLDGDTALAEREGVDLLFVPTGDEMYPEGLVRTSISVAEVSEPLEGRSRPTHFAGVATVVAKLFAIVGSCSAYFGEKDFQQVAVVRQMVRDLSMPVDVVACPTLREPDGLALSSRNAYLTPEERAAAPVVHAALQMGRADIDAGERDPAKVRALMADLIAAEPLAELDYAEVVDARTLQEVDPLTGELRLLIAARFGRARLIDNLAARAD
jgi:pantoate--beta-alanine ligase